MHEEIEVKLTFTYIYIVVAGSECHDWNTLFFHSCTVLKNGVHLPFVFVNKK
jgi:hypothetical protein